MRLPVADTGCCAGHDCDGCAACTRGHCCRTDNPGYCLPKVGDWDGVIYGSVGVRNIVGDEMECHACGGFYRGVGAHAWQAHDLTAAEYKAIFGLIRRHGLLAPASREKFSARSKRQWDTGVMDTVDLEAMRSHRTPEQRAAALRVTRERMSPEEVAARTEFFRGVGRSWKGRSQTPEHVKKRTESRMKGSTP